MGLVCIETLNTGLSPYLVSVLSCCPFFSDKCLVYRFGKLRLYANVRVGKDGHTWQELECYLFSEMLICVKEKKNSGAPDWDDSDVRPKTSRCTLKGSILIKKHLKQVASSPSEFAPPIGEDAGFMEASIAGRPASKSLANDILLAD
jgi:hypothetical protein